MISACSGLGRVAKIRDFHHFESRTLMREDTSLMRGGGLLRKTKIFKEVSPIGRLGEFTSGLEVRSGAEPKLSPWAPSYSVLIVTQPLSYQATQPSHHPAASSLASSPLCIYLPSLCASVLYRLPSAPTLSSLSILILY